MGLFSLFRGKIGNKKTSKKLAWIKDDLEFGFERYFFLNHVNGYTLFSYKLLRIRCSTTLYLTGSSFKYFLIVNKMATIRIRLDPALLRVQTLVRVNNLFSKSFFFSSVYWPFPYHSCIQLKSSLNGLCNQLNLLIYNQSLSYPESLIYLRLDMILVILAILFWAQENPRYLIFMSRAIITFQVLDMDASDGPKHDFNLIVQMKLEILFLIRNLQKI